MPGNRPLVLVAPHGGRRDAARRPWAAGHLRVNDLHTATLAAELAEATGAAALINADRDRNDVDLNRIVEAHDRAPRFLEQLAELLEPLVARHGRLTLLALHGWNVVQPAVDLGLGCAAGPQPCAVTERAAVSPAFAAAAVPALLAASAARGIAATVASRYPARHRENLVQLFTPRYRDDPRPLVRALAARAARVDAVQLELGIPLRWPGAWRDRLVAACREALPALLAPVAAAAPVAAGRPGSTPSVRRLEFATATLSGLVGIERERARLLLFPGGTELLLFTGERTVEDGDGIGGLELRPGAHGGIAIAFRGPLLRFPDTMPFLDLERGLAGARLVEAQVALAFRPDDSGSFGRVSGAVVLDGVAVPVDGRGFTEAGVPAGPWPRLRTALWLGGDRLALTLALRDGGVSGVLHRDGTCLPVLAARATLGEPDAPLARLALELELAGGERVRVEADAVVRVPVVRARGPVAVRVELAACRLPGESTPAGWCEVGGL
jgi:hypothetical protein